MKYILTSIFSLLLNVGYSQYNGLTTVYKMDSVDVFIDISNYNEHYLRQELADSIFYKYTHYEDKNTPIELKDYTVEGELTVEQFSPRTIVLFYECEKFTKK